MIDVAVAANSGDILGVILQSSTQQAPKTITQQQEQDDDALIKQWLTGGA